MLMADACFLSILGFGIGGAIGMLGSAVGRTASRSGPNAGRSLAQRRAWFSPDVDPKVRVNEAMDQAARVLGYNNLADFSKKMDLPVTINVKSSLGGRAAVSGKDLLHGNVKIEFDQYQAKNLPDNQELIHAGVHELIHVRQFNTIRNSMFGGDAKAAGEFWQSRHFFDTTDDGRVLRTRSYWARELGTERKAIRAMTGMYGNSLSERVTKMSNAVLNQARDGLGLGQK